MPLTEQQARRASDARKLTAVQTVLARYGAPTDIAPEIIAAYKSAEVVLPDECPDVHPNFGACVREYGHPADDVEPSDGSPKGKYGGHYTGEYEDERRPDGSHPWDY